MVNPTRRMRRFRNLGVKEIRESPEFFEPGITFVDERKIKNKSKKRRGVTMAKRKTSSKRGRYLARKTKEDGRLLRSEEASTRKQSRRRASGERKRVSKKRRKGTIKKRKYAARKSKNTSKKLKHTTKKRKHINKKKRHGRRLIHVLKGRSWILNLYRNPRHYIRTRNPGASDVLIPVLCAIGGLVGAGYLMQKIPEDKVPSVGGFNLSSLIPAAVGIAAMKFLTGKFPKYANIIYGVGFGLVLASGVKVYNMIAQKANLPAISSGEQVVSAPQLPASGQSTSGYIHSLGQFDSGFEDMPQEVNPYGITRVERSYDDATWAGVYSQSNYE